MPNITAAPVIHKIVSKQRSILIENTTSETDLWTYTVPANTLGTLNSLHVRLVGTLFNNSGSSATFTMKWHFGATVLYSDAFASVSSNSARRPIDFDVILGANNATNSQVFGGQMIVANVSSVATVGAGDLGTDEQLAIAPIIGAASTEDSTASKIFKVTVTMSAANVNTEILINHAYVELIAL